MNQYLIKWAGKELMAELEEGIINAPQDLLGCHVFKEEGVQIFTAYRPCAETVWVLSKDGTVAGEMEPMEIEGLFGYVIEKKKDFLDGYRFRVKYTEDDVIEIEDPYAYEKQITDFDCYVFGEGKHYQIYEKLGAHLETIQGVRGTRFAVWAPSARSVSVIGEFNMWDGRLHRMMLHGGSGIFELFIPGAWEGAAYKYEITARDGEKHYKTDPYGNYAQLRPDNASRITSLSGYEYI